MRISPITQNKFFNFRSKVTDVMHGDISDDLAQKIDDFEETHKNAKELGSGLFATAYVLNGTNYVIKESLPTKLARKQNDNFFPEARALEMLPPSVKNTQRLVAHVKTEKDNYYLLSTFVEGLPASYPSHPWNKNSFLVPAQAFSGDMTEFSRHLVHYHTKCPDVAAVVCRLACFLVRRCINAGARRSFETVI